MQNVEGGHGFCLGVWEVSFKTTGAKIAYMISHPQEYNEKLMGDKCGAAKPHFTPRSNKILHFKKQCPTTQKRLLPSIRSTLLPRKTLLKF